MVGRGRGWERARVILASERLVLRPFAAADGPALHAYLSQPDVVRFEPYGPQDAAACDRLARERADDDRFLAACTADGTLVGHVYLAPDGPEEWRTWEIGYVFNPAYGGLGYATEAARRVVTHLVADERAHRVVVHCDPRNERSWRLAERLGMRREGHFLQAVSFEDDEHGEPIWHDAYLYAVLADEWRG